VEQRTQLVIGGGQDKFDVNAAIKAVLNVTAEKGATLERIMKETNLTSEQLVLPMALLMKTERLHFKRSGTHDVYVSKGKATEKPEIPPPEEPLKRKLHHKTERPKPEELEPTASVLVFGRRKSKKKKI